MGSPFALRAAFAGAPLLVVDSVTEALQHPPGAVLVTGSHGGLSAGRFALQARPLLVVFNDAGVGKDAAGIAALALLQAAGIAACAVAHDSARIGEAHSTLDDGVVSFANDAAVALGLEPGRRLSEGLSEPSAVSSPARR
ncbi:MAG: hypothetical protein KF683_24450 [Rubrivivax sp.]|nr:hypothetical protein [Rubrivivax sp.]